MKSPIGFTMVFVFAGCSIAADKALIWPQFRGPNGSGVADNQKPPIDIGPDKNVKWKVKAPSGLSSPIVAGDNLVITAFDDGKLYTIAYNRADGKEAWWKEAPAKKIEAYFKANGSPASCTRTTDGEHIVAYFGSCGLICYDLAGKELWKYELPPTITAGDFGSGSSPILVDGLVVLVRDELKDPKIYAIDVGTGSIKWEKKRRSVASYCSPVVWDLPSGKQIVSAGHAQMIGYDLKSGDEKWSVFGVPSSACSSPVAFDGTLLYAGSSPGGTDDKEFQMPTFDSLLKAADTDKDGTISKEEASKSFLKDFFDSQDTNKDGKVTRGEWDAVVKFMSEGKSGAFALKAGGTGDVTKSHVVWTKTKGLPYITSPIAYHGQFVMVKDGGLVTVYDVKTGKDVYVQERAVAGGQYYASPVAANGNIYFTSYDEGIVTVLKAGSTEVKEVARNPKLGERVAATPAIADDTLYIRTSGHLYAFSKK